MESMMEPEDKMSLWVPVRMVELPAVEKHTFNSTVLHVFSRFYACWLWGLGIWSFLKIHLKNFPLDSLCSASPGKTLFFLYQGRKCGQDMGQTQCMERLDYHTTTGSWPKGQEKNSKYFIKYFPSKRINYVRLKVSVRIIIPLYSKHMLTMDEHLYYMLTFITSFLRFRTFSHPQHIKISNSRPYSPVLYLEL